VMVAIAEQLRAEGIVFSLYDNDEGEVVIQRAYSDGVRFGPDELAAAGAHVRAPVDSVPLYHELMATRRPIFIEDINLDQRVAMNRHVLQAQGMVSFVLVPLLLGESVVGSFAILSRKRRRFDDAEVELARTLATQATLALQLERMDRQGRHNAILQERNRLAREIHDTLAQGFTSIVIHLQLAEAAMRLKPEKALPAILKARDVARDSLAEARRSVWALRPNALQGSGIADGLRRLCDSMAGSEDAPVRPRVVLEGEARPLPAETEGHLLRLGQEAINNALKYAAARDICVTVTFEAGHVRLCVRDDGRGFDKGDKPRGSGFGHQSMRERVAALGGELHIESAPGAGTTVRVSIPAPSTGPSPSSSLGDGGGGNTPESQTR